MERTSVLIVDDDMDIRDLLGETLRERGFDVLTARNGLDALKVLQDGARPSVILLDLMMPVMDGYGFLQQRSLDPALATIPVVIATAGHGVDRTRFGDDLEIVTKPFDIPKLIGVLNAMRARSNPAA